MIRRSLLMFGIIVVGILIFEAGWQINGLIMDDRQQFRMPNLWPPKLEFLAESSTWFNALVQMIFSLQIGVGTLPVMTGKFLYKGDAVRTCAIFICFNVLVLAAATAYYLTIFDLGSMTAPFPDLTTLTTIYDRAFNEESHTYLRSLIPSLAYTMVFLAGLISLSITIYASSRILKRHPNYIMCLVGMFISIAGLICPNFLVARLLDTKIIGTVIICAMIFEVIGISWVYGSKNLSIDLEFSVGHPISRVWLFFWKIAPLILAPILVWWTVMHSSLEFDRFADIAPRWIPIVASCVVIFMFAIYKVTKQVDYNTWNMICEATKPAKDWGPGDPIVRHAWKQWKAVCDDTGKRDFTLKRRGTKDWTSSIKKGQYSHATRNNSFLSGTTATVINNNNNHEKKHAMSTGGSNSPNYSGSVFGDSAIEEDMNSDKYIPSNHHDLYASVGQADAAKPRRNTMNKKISDVSQRTSSFLFENEASHQQPQQPDFYSQKIPIRISNGNKHDNYTSRIEIVPPADSSYSQFQPYSTFVHRLPMTTEYSEHFEIYNPSRRDVERNQFHAGRFSEESSSAASTRTTNTGTTAGVDYEHNWRQFEANNRKIFHDEFSTEL